MKKAIILHGMISPEETTSPVEKHWLPWLKSSLEQAGYTVYLPIFPEPHRPEYISWKNTFEQFPCDEETILIGHSCGAGFVVRYMSEESVNVGKVFLIAPWIDTRHELQTYFFDFTIDEHLSEKTQRIDIFYSTDDDDEILESIDVLKQKLPEAYFHEFTDRGHFTTEPGYDNDTFPELLEAIQKTA